MNINQLLIILLISIIITGILFFTILIRRIKRTQEFASVASYNSACKEFKKIDTDIYKISGGETGGELDPELLDRPYAED